MAPFCVSCGSGYSTISVFRILHSSPPGNFEWVYPGSLARSVGPSGSEPTEEEEREDVDAYR